MNSKKFAEIIKKTATSKAENKYRRFIAVHDTMFGEEPTIEVLHDKNELLEALDSIRWLHITDLLTKTTYTFNGKEIRDLKEELEEKVYPFTFDELHTKEEIQKNFKATQKQLKKIEIPPYDPNLSGRRWGMNSETMRNRKDKKWKH